MSEQSRIKRAQSISRVHGGSPKSVAYEVLNIFVESLQDASSETHKRVAGQVEALPHQVIGHVRTFTENMQYLMKPEVLVDKNESVPAGLKRLLDGVAGTEKISNRIKREILRDQDARRVSGYFFVPRTLHTILFGRHCFLSILKVTAFLSCWVP